MFDLSKHTPKKLNHSPFEDAHPKKTRPKSRAQEDRVAQIGGGRRQPASGAGRAPEAKGDVRGVKHYLIECKRTDKAWIYIEPNTFPKIELEAGKLGKTPLVQVDIDGRREGEIRSWFFKPDVMNVPSLLAKEAKGSGLNLTVTLLRKMDEFVTRGYLPKFEFGHQRDIAGMEGVIGGRRIWTAFPESRAKELLGI